MRQPRTESNGPPATTPTTPRPKSGGVILALLLVVAATFLFRFASGSGMIPGNNTPMDQFDYLMHRGLPDAFEFVGTLVKEGPAGAYEQTTSNFQKNVPPETFAAFIRKYPAIRQIIRDEKKIPPGAVEVDGGESSQPFPQQIHWQGNLPTDDETEPTVYLEMVVEDGKARVDLIRVRDDTLPSS